MKNFIFLFSFTFSTLVSFTVFSQQDYQQDYQQEKQEKQQGQQQENQHFSEAELAQMLAPIALYPDSLLTHILISSTYPLEIVEAHRWLKKNDKLNSAQIAQSIENIDWDASVKALVPFEQILSRLSDDLSWMQQLGDAFLQDEARVLESIQALREQAKLAGNLDKMDNMDISYEDNNIVIEPVTKEIVYVPYYDTRMVYGAWYWSSYPPVYWRPRHSVYVNHYNPFHWHSGIHISFNYFFSAFHWHNRHVVVVNPHRSHHRYYHQRPRRLIASGGYAKRWSHQPAHRRGVAYRNKHVGQKYHSSRTKTHKTGRPSQYSHRQFKQRLSANNHSFKRKESKKETKISQTRNKESLRGTPKSYSANVQHKDIKQNKSHRAKKSHGPNNSVKKVTPKRHKESVNKHHSKAGGKSNNRSNRKQHHQSAPLKTHHSNHKKARN